jgi:hypothetical protein
MSKAAGDLDCLSKEYAEVETWADTTRAERACRVSFPASERQAAAVAADARRAAAAAAEDLGTVAKVKGEAEAQSRAVQAQVKPIVACRIFSILTASCQADLALVYAYPTLS